MAVPTKPYCTSSQVAMLLTNGYPDGFNLKTRPTSTQIETHLIWISNQVDMQFSQAGYIVPLQALDAGWPDHQSYYLQMVTALGVAALAGGFSVKPAPALNPGRNNSTGNVFQDLYNTELKKIYDDRVRDTSIRFQAKTYAGSLAERSITEPIGPSLDYMTGDMNPEGIMSFLAYTDLKYNIQCYVENYNLINNPLNWNDFFGMYSEKLAGYSYNVNS